jgi:DeoR family deoxyribose operon repressor
MSKKTDRLSRLIDIIKTKNGATVKELASLLDVSEMTIRRDLAVLEQNSIVNNVYGAAIYNPSYDSLIQKEHEKNFTSQKQFTPQKQFTSQKQLSSQEEPTSLKVSSSQTENSSQKELFSQTVPSSQMESTALKGTTFLKGSDSLKDVASQEKFIFHKGNISPKNNTFQNGNISMKESNPFKENNSLYELNHAKSTQDTEKKSIGAFAASYINNGDIVVIDTGSTTEMLAENIPDDLEATILCYNANILSSLRLKEKLTLIFSGGKYHPTTQMVESPQGVELIKSMRFTKAFISAAGIHAGLGVTCVFDYEVATKKAIMDSSVEKILLFDSSKFNQVKPAYFGDLTDFDVIITDNDISDEWRELISAHNIKLYTVPV